MMEKKCIILLICMISICEKTWSQQVDPCDLDPFCEDIDGMEEVPLDGGLAFLVAAGLLYGSKRIKEMRKQKT